MSVCLVFVAPDKKEVVENGDHLPADSPPPDDEYQSSESSVVEGSLVTLPLSVLDWSLLSTLAEEDYFSKTAELSELIDQLSEKRYVVSLSTSCVLPSNLCE